MIKCAKDSGHYPVMVYTTRNRSIVILRRDSRQADIVLSPS
jgi:hypothetical protein